MTDIWVKLGVSPQLWAELMWVQERADWIFAPENPADAYPDRMLDKDLLFLSYHLPSPLGVALLQRRLLRGLALREMHRAMA